MILKERIIKTEEEFPKRFASYIEKYYGILFYNQDNKESHDSNHAILYVDKINDLENILLDVKEFYLGKGITPRVYKPFMLDIFEANREMIGKLSFRIENYGTNRFMMLTSENNIETEKRLDIRQISEWDVRIANDIYIPNGEEYEIEVLRNSIRNKDTHMFIGYLDGIAVTNTHFHISEYGCTRFDYISTAKDFRGKGYAREILSYVVSYCKKNNIINCYQWPAHETSERICYEAGFRVIFEAEAGAIVYN